MIYIRAEMWPGGDDSRARCLFEGIVHNTGGDARTGEYEYLFSRVGGFKADAARIRSVDVINVLRRGEVKGFPRLKLYAHDLILRALRSAYGERNP